MSHHQTNLLYVVATPIGNLEDITLRALNTLEAVDLVLSENVAKTRNLLRHYGIKSRVRSYREANYRRVIPDTIDVLGSGRSVALVAEAGTPGISDPGRRLVAAVRGAGFRVVPVPGASALVSALSVAGIDEPRFIFEGFLPRKRSKRRRRLEEIGRQERALVVFEAPHRLVDCLADIEEVLGDRHCVVAREITKVYEEIQSGSVSTFITKFTAAAPKGEFVIVVEGGVSEAEGVPRDKMLGEAGRLLRKGMRKTQVAKAIAKKYGLKSRDVYDIIARR
jgi:16S rRNA (cytidine1402-2'-O)-methyltransferase